MGRTAITGTASFLGSKLVRRLMDLHGPDSLVCIDITAPPAALAGVRYREVDLTEPVADQKLLEVLKEEGCTRVVHMAFLTNPTRDSTYAHELESIGTLNLLAAAVAAGVERVLLRSFTAVYGARGQNPNFLTEDHALRPNPALGWARDKLEAEQHATSFARRYPKLQVTVLRYATLFGPGVHNFYTSIFDKRLVPVLLGYDPLIQLLHPEDALRATTLALAQQRPLPGAVNVVPRGTVPLVSALHLASKVPVGVPHPLAVAATDALWAAGLAPAPGAFLDYVRYLCVADGRRAEKDLGFRPLYSSRDALLAYLAYRHPEPRRVEASA